jgi:hypothetical protein
MGKPITDEILKMHLTRHFYMLEVNRKLFELANGKNFDQIIIPEKAVADATEKHIQEFGIPKDEIGPNVAYLVTQQYLKLWSPDEKKTMFLNVLPKGMSAMSSGEFYQAAEGRERDLLQKELVEHQKKFNNRTIILSGLSVLFIAVSTLLQYRDKTDQRVKELQQTMQGQSSTLESTRLYLQGIHYYLFAPKDSNGVKPDPSHRIP